jgi:hypothetical protein
MKKIPWKKLRAAAFPAAKTVWTSIKEPDYNQLEPELLALFAEPEKKPKEEMKKIDKADTKPKVLRHSAWRHG